MASQRSDAALIRWLTEQRGAACAQAWQRPPLVRLPGEGFVDYVWEHQQDLAESMPEVDQLPWDEVILDYDRGRTVLMRRVIDLLAARTRLSARDITGGASDAPEQVVPLTPRGSEVPDRGHCWARVCTLRRYLQTERIASPWLIGDADLLAHFRGQPNEWLVIEVWEDNVAHRGGGTGFPHYPDVSLVRRSLPWQRDSTAHLYPNQDCRSGRAYGAGFCSTSRCQFSQNDPRYHTCVGSDMIMQTGVILTLITLAYLLRTDEHLVEVTPELTAGERKMEDKASAKKPWTRAGLPHYILLDPSRAREYGARAGASDDVAQMGKRTSPSAHGRRGHWSHLRAERFIHTEEDRSQLEARGYVRRIWVKPAWIGPDAWLSEGQRYRVVAPAAGPSP